MFAAEVPEQNWAMGVPVHLDLPSATGSGALSYSFSPAAELPQGVVYRPATNDLDGTPSGSQGWETFAWTASETAGDGESTLQIRISVTPVRPAHLGATPQDGQLNLGWSFTRVDSGSPGWELSRDGGPWEAISPVVSPNGRHFNHLVTGLTNGTEYEFRVRAVAGSGAAAVRGEAISQILTPFGPPAKPDRLLATPGNGQVTLWWVPGDDGGSPVNRHRYRQKAGAGAWGNWIIIADSAPDGANDATYTVPDLTNGTLYTFQVRAESSGGGDGAESDEATATPVEDTAPVFAGETLIGGTYAVGTPVNETLPIALGGDGDLSYELTPAPPDGLSLDAATRALSGTPTTSGATATHTYSVADGDSNTAATDTDTLAFDISVAPAKALGVTATPGDGQAALSWAHPGDSGVTGWQSTLDDGVSWSDLVPDNQDWKNETIVEATLTGLDNDTRYFARVRAVAGSGSGAVTGATSDRVGFTPLAPGATANLSASPGDGQVALSWTAGGDGGSPITKHQYRQKAGTGNYGNWTTIPDSSPECVSIPGETCG